MRFYCTKRARSHFKASVGAFEVERGAALMPTCCITRAPMCGENPFGNSPDQTAAIHGLQAGTEHRQLYDWANPGRGPAAIRAIVTIPAHRCTDRAALGGGTCRARGPAVWYHHHGRPTPPPPHSGRETESVRAHTNTHTHRRRRRRRLVNGNVFERACGLHLS